MKRILTLIIGFMAMVLLLATPVHAVLIEHEVDFSLVSYSTTTSSYYIKVNTGENLYDKFDALFDMEPDMSYKLPITIKRGALTYSGEIYNYYDTTWGSLRYNIQINLSSTTYFKVFVFEDVITPGSAFGGTINKNQAIVTSPNIPLTSFGLYLDDYKILAMLESELDPEEGTDVDEFNDLPSTIGTLADAANTSMVGLVYFTHSEDYLFEVYVLVGGQQFNLGLLELPGVEELNKEPLSPGIYWTEGNKRYIYYEFQLPPSVKPIDEQLNIFLDDPSQINGFRPFVTMNLTDETYVFTDKLTLYSGYYGGPNGEAYADVVFPFELDELLSIEMYYSFRWQILWGLGGYTAWESQRVTRYINDAVDMRTTWQHITSWVNWFEFYNEVSSWISGPSPTIQPLTVTPSYKSKYTDEINKVRLSEGKSALTVDQIFPVGSDVFRVYLNTFNDGRYTGYEIHDEIIVMDVMYSIDGEVYHVAYDDIEQGGSFGGGGPGLGGQDPQAWDWSWFTDLFGALPEYVIIIGAVIVALLAFPYISKLFDTTNKIIKDPKKLLLYAVVVIGILFLLGYL